MELFLINIAAPQIIFHLWFWLRNEKPRGTIGRYISDTFCMCIPIINWAFVILLIMIEISETDSFKRNQEINKRTILKIREFLNKKI